MNDYLSPFLETTFLNAWCWISFFFFNFFLLFFRGIYFTSIWLPLHQEASALKNNFCMRDEQRSINSRDVDLVAQVDDHTNLIAWLTPRLSSFRVQANVRGAFCTYFLLFQ